MRGQKWLKNIIWEPMLYWPIGIIAIRDLDPSHQAAAQQIFMRCLGWVLTRQLLFGTQVTMSKRMVFDSVTPIKNMCKCLTLTENHWKLLHERHAYEHDYYFVSQLYEPEWKPRSSRIRWYESPHAQYSISKCFVLLRGSGVGGLTD